MYKTLSSEQRYQIAALLAKNHSYTDIAQIVGCHKSTISREVTRNSKCNNHKDVYEPKFAHHLSVLRQKFKNKADKMTDQVRRRIVWLIRKKWSPEQIHHVCKKRKLPMVSIEWIYQYIYWLKSHGYDLCQFLRRGHRKRRKRKNQSQNRRIIKDRISISKRTAGANNASRLGHMEIDLMKCKNGYLLTMTDRKTLYNIIHKIPNKSTRAVIRAIRCMKKLGFQIKSITSDNGTEFTKHKLASMILNCQWYFADPYSPQQRGCNENQNGLIRQYAPRNMDLKKVTQKEIFNWEKQLNYRPRKKLNYLKPFDLFKSCNVALVT